MNKIKVASLVLLALLLYGVSLLQIQVQLEHRWLANDYQVLAADEVLPILTTINVTTMADEFKEDGNCSLREAIVAANTDTVIDACPAGHEVDLINLPAGIYTILISGGDENNARTGDLDLSSNLFIKGAGEGITIIDGNQLDRVFEVIGPVAVSISGLTIRNGNPVAATDGQNRNGGGILVSNNATLNLTSIDLQGNQANEGGGLMNAGGIVNISESIISKNTATSAGGVGNDGLLSISHSIIESNQAQSDAGGILSATSLTMQSCTVSNNIAGNNGGGVYILQGTGSITDCTIRGNAIGGFHGGGIFAYDQGKVTIINTSITENNGGDGANNYDQTG